jgi:alanine-synthesizing transaminase
MNTEFHQIKRLPPYVFEEVNRIKAAARASGKDIIDFGMGNPDLPTPDFIVEKLAETAWDPKAHRYSSSKGLPGLRKAIAGYYDRRFQVGLNPDTEVVATLGSKEGFANLAHAMTAPGDVILVPNPTYPIHAFGFILAGAALRHIPISSGEEFFRHLDQAVRYSVPKPSAVVVNFPANPTAQVADLDFYDELVRFARKHEIYVLSDIAYSEIYFDDVPPPSILQIEGARDIAVEFGSLSKTYSMPGWRMGFAVGNENLISALTRIKSYLDYGAFTPIQVAATTALNGPDSVVEEIRSVYKARRDVLVESMSRAGWEIPAPKATMFAWAELPEVFKSLGSMEFSKLLLTHAEVAVSPGIGFGEFGEGHVRVALVENEQRIRQAARNVRKFMSNADTIMANYNEKGTLDK